MAWREAVLYPAELRNTTLQPFDGVFARSRKRGSKSGLDFRKGFGPHNSSAFRYYSNCLTSRVADSEWSPRSIERKCQGLRFSGTRL